MSHAKVEDQPSVAGVYDYYLGGTAHTAADRVAAKRIGRMFPDVVDAAWANRGFLQRAVRRLAGEWGVSQFFDFGGLLPDHRNTHEVVAELVPDGRVVYVADDPRVVDQARRMLAGVAGATVIYGDVRRPERVLGHPQTRQLIDFDQPVGLLLVAVMQFVSDADDPWGIARRYLRAVAPGSWLALSGLTSDHRAGYLANGSRQICDRAPVPATFRAKPDIERFFDGLEILPPYEGARPAVSYVGEWGAEDPVLADSDGSRWFYAAVGRKPEGGGGW